VLFVDSDRPSEQSTGANPSSTIPSVDRIMTLLDRYLLYTDSSRFKEALFKYHVQELTYRISSITVTALALLVLLCWPTDWIIFEDPEIITSYTIWRSSVIVISVITMGLLYLSENLRRNINTVLVTTASLTLLMIGYSLGRLGDMTEPWIWVVYCFPWMTIPFALKPLPRLVSTAILPASYAFGYFIASFPTFHYMEYEYLGVPFILGAALVPISSLIGHIFYHMYRQNFFNRRTIQYKQQQVEHMATHDQLTGLLNRRKFEQRFEEEFDRAQRYEEKLTLLMIDLDHFKDVNDTFGHQAGDNVLSTTGEIIRSETRISDVGSRYGGEEFCVILTETSMKGASKTAERLRNKLSERQFTNNDGDEFTVTCSIGMAELDQTYSETEELLRDADEALYEAKETGRDQIVKAS
jgi:diguanylate cyclase (GGDEF)-like protein